jgi:hypothetical protein
VIDLQPGYKAGEIEPELAQELPDYLAHQPAIARRRGDSARSNRTADLEAMRAGIIAAIGALAPLPNCPLGQRKSIVLHRM